MPHPTPALPECQLPDQLCRSQTSLAQGHILDMLLLTDTPNPHGFSLAPEQLSRSLAVPPGHLQLSTNSGLRLPHCIPQHPPTPHATSTHFAPCFPISPGMHKPRVHICCTLQGWEKLGSVKHPGLIKTHQFSLRCTRRRTPCQCQKCLPGQ